MSEIILFSCQIYGLCFTKMDEQTDFWLFLLFSVVVVVLLFRNFFNFSSSVSTHIKSGREFSFLF